MIWLTKFWERVKCVSFVFILVYCFSVSNWNVWWMLTMVYLFPPERECDIPGCERCFPDDGDQCMACKNNFYLSKDYKCVGKYLSLHGWHLWRPWGHHRLSLWQPVVPPVATKLPSWHWLSIYNDFVFSARLTDMPYIICACFCCGDVISFRSIYVASVSLSFRVPSSNPEWYK